MITLFLLLILISTWVGFYQLVKQQGRILLRLDALERNLPATANEHAQVDGLPLGSVFPNFELPDLSGKMRALAEFKGEQLLLIRWSFDCGFCEAIADDLVASEGDLQKRNARIVLLASGDEASNHDHAAQHGMNMPILLLRDRPTPEPFAQRGTPVAYYVDEAARVGAPFASGADQVLALARRIASSSDTVEPKSERSHLKNERPLSESHIERNGLKPGTPAPNFLLPDLQGHSISLNDFGGRRVLLVFSDPHCGPCDELSPHLVRLHQEHRNNGLAVLLVGRGSVEENRKKAEQFGFEFPVVLQDKWKLSKEYGIFATPVAFLIAENGMIAKDVAVGKEAILALAR
jgi:peroxiredoxin